LDVRQSQWGSACKLSPGGRNRNLSGNQSQDPQTRGHLVATCETISAEYAIPVVNKRIAVTPGSADRDGIRRGCFIEIAHALDEAASEMGVDFLALSANISSHLADGIRTS